jgi:c-di-GMP-binding flagellar brake protein YcgR
MSIALYSCKWHRIGRKLLHQITMNTADKKSLIVLRDKQHVNRYLDEIARNDLAARVVIDGTISLNDCRLVSTGKKSHIVLETNLMSGEYPESGHADVTFAGDIALYKFTTAMLSMDITPTRRMRLTLAIPKTITKKERRMHVRVKPQVINPLAVRVHVPNSETIDVEPVDISQGGISFTLTEYKTHFKSGDPVDLFISVPRVKNLSAGAIIRNVIHLMDLTRIGAQFSVLSEDAAKIIIEYVELCEKQIQEDAYDEE